MGPEEAGGEWDGSRRRERRRADKAENVIGKPALDNVSEARPCEQGCIYKADTSRPTRRCQAKKAPDYSETVGWRRVRLGESRAEVATGRNGRHPLCCPIRE